LRNYIVLFFLIISIQIIHAQTYQAPILACVQRTSNSNSIVWRVPNETCGAFQKYNIFYATSQAGPYQLLTTITSTTITSYNHTGINLSQTYYYYMTSEYNCPSTSLSSDTMNDALIPYPELQSISIENGYPYYTWIPITSLIKVHSYIIFYPGDKIVDTVYGRTSSNYTDSSFNVNSGIYTGNVAAFDSCGGVYGRGQYPPIFHRPCYLTLVNNPCDDEIELSWTQYQGWGPNDEVKDYEIMVSKNGAPEVKVATNDPSSRSFRYSDFVYGDTLCIRVRANHPTKTNVYSHSNQFCFVSSKSQVPHIFQTLSASYIDNYSTKIRWYCSPDAIPKSFDLTKYNAKAKSKILTLEMINYVNEGNGYYSFIDTNGEYLAQTSYEMVYEDLCNNKSKGVIGNTNFINVTQIGLYTNEIKWSPKFFPDSVAYTISKYELYFSPDMTSFTKLADIQSMESKYIHNVESLYQSSGKFCYKLVVHYSFDTTPFLKDSVYFMASQSKCVLMRTVLWMPNAFKINGYTPTFKPKMYFFSNEIFRMKIFNRWGQQIFDTNDPNIGWNGVMYNGQMASEDSYIYHVSYQGNDGVMVDKTGTFVLLK